MVRGRYQLAYPNVSILCVLGWVRIIASDRTRAGGMGGKYVVYQLVFSQSSAFSIPNYSVYPPVPFPVPEKR